MTTIAKVAVEKTSIRFDKLFDYSIPDSLIQQIQVGCRVSVPFGYGNKYRQGIVLDIENVESTAKLKQISAVLDSQSILSSEMVDIIKHLVSTTFCTYYEAVRTVLPAGFSYQIQKTYRLGDAAASVDRDQLSSLETEILHILLHAQSQEEIDRAVERQLELHHRAEIDRLTELEILIPESDVKRRVGDKTVNMVRLAQDVDLESIKLSVKQKRVTDLLGDVGFAAIREACYLCGVTDIVVKNLAKRGVVELYEREVYRNPYADARQAVQPDDIVLTPAQQRVFEGILRQYRENTPSAALLHGVTGSGKTQVFIKLIDTVVRSGKQAVLLVPEISLTPQMLAKFQSVFGKQVAVMHSSLSLGEQLDEYKRIKNGDARIVIGTRSAVFAPFDNIGLIILDEEGEPTYKSADMAPRYHARDIAKYRCLKHGALLLLASATPSVESYYNAKSGKYALYELKERYAEAVLPEVSIIDMRSESSSMVSGVSELLAEELYRNLETGEQSILLLNRRGYNSALTCVDCGWVAECPHCSVAMTYHRANGYLMCHYCGCAQEVVKTCPQCGGKHMLLTGQGTQKIEDELEGYFPKARILRMDADTTYSRALLEEKISQFAKGEYDILVGTQIVAKGLNFKNVTLVGVLSADSMLYSNDFKAPERAFSLLTQVVGRSGRGQKPGRAYIQTYNPDNPVIQQAATQNYAAFYEDEIITRKAFFYPPFCDICLIGITGVKEAEVEHCARLFAQMLKASAQGLTENIPLKVLGRSKPAIYRMNNKYRQRIILKCRNNANFRRYMHKLLRMAASRKEFSNVHLYADINGEIH